MIEPTQNAVGSHVRHYWQNGGMVPGPLPSFRRHGPRMKDLGPVILTCFSSPQLSWLKRNIKVFTVLERSMRRHKVFCSIAQKIIHKVNHWHLFEDFTKECSRMSIQAVAWSHGRDCYLKPICEENVYDKGVYWI